jgi:RNA polymerase sigma-70 factor (ECF subfamily)
LILDVREQVAEALRAMRRMRVVPSAPAAVSRDLGEIYRAYAADVSRWARRLRGPQTDVEDVVHEVFLVAHRRLPEFRGDAKLSTWLYAITVRVVQGQRRKERWLRWLRLDRLLGAEPVDPSTPLQAFESRRASELTYRLLETLPEAERSALILFELEGLSGEEIAAVTAEAVGTIWVRLHRARARFRKAFLAWENREPGGKP